MSKRGKPKIQSVDPSQPSPQEASHLKPDLKPDLPPVKVKVLVSQSLSRRAPPPRQAPPSPTNEPKVNVLISSNTRHKSAKATQPTTKLGSLPPTPALPSCPELDEWEDETLEERAPIRVLSSSVRSANPFIKAVWVTTSWLGVGALVAGGGWLAFQLMINPGSISWMQWMLPEASRGSFLAEDAPRSLQQIQEQAKATNLYLGSPFPLGDTGDLVIPISAHMTPCSGLEALPAASCGEIQELRVYRPSTAARREVTYELVDRLAMPGLEEYFVMTPLTATTDNEGSSRRLLLTTVGAINGTAPTRGTWFQVSGERIRGDTRIVYGQTMSYDPQTGRLETHLQWTSPTAELPGWKDIVVGDLPELVVNQTLGLEPKFELYQIKSTSTSRFELKPISLTEPAFRSATYKNGLLLAQSGLWSPALQVLQAVKDRSQNDSSQWSPTAQAQLDLIRLHAEVTQAQAKRAWANPSEHITALLIDGRWAEALQQFQDTLKDGHDLTSLLRDDAKILWRRVEAALKVDRRNYDVQAWGALTIATKQGRRAAIAWLQTLHPALDNTRQTTAQTSTPVDPRLQSILTLLSLIPRSDSSYQSSQFLGLATPISTLNPRQWTVAEPNTALDREPQQVWYQVQITRLHNGQRWWRSPFTSLNLPTLGIAHELWELMGLSANSEFQAAFWSSDGQFQTQSLTAKAIRYNNGTLQLLAVGDELPTNNRLSQALAMTNDTLQWLEPNYAMTLADLSQQQPAWMPIVLPAVWQQLQQAGYVTATTPSPDEMLQAIGPWSVQLIDFTGNNQPEIRLIVQPASLMSSSYADSNAVNELQTAPFRTLIFLDQGNLIYNELGERGQTLIAIATLANESIPTLLLTTEQGYLLKQWSPQSQQFQ